MRQFHPDMLFSKTQVRINNRKNALYITQMQNRIHNLQEDFRKNELVRQNERRQIEKIRHQMKMQMQGWLHYTALYIFILRLFVKKLEWSQI